MDGSNFFCCSAESKQRQRKSQYGNFSHWIRIVFLLVVRIPFLLFLNLIFFFFLLWVPSLLQEDKGDKKINGWIS